MTDPKEKPATGLRAPKAKKTLGLAVPPALRMPHEVMFRPEDSPPSEAPQAPDRVSVPDRVSDSTLVVEDTVSYEQGSPRPQSRVSQPDTLSALSRVKVEKHYSRLLNSVIDGVLRTLPQPAQIVYIHLHRLSYGNGRNWCRIGHPKLAERTGIGETTVRRAIGQLVDRKLVTIAVQEFGGPQKGTTYYIPLPPDTPAGAVTLVAADTLSAEDTVSASATMKENMKYSHEKAPAAAALALTVYDVRKRAAQIYEARHRDPSFHAATLKAELRSELDGEGHEVSDAIVDEAVRGMM